MNDKMRSVLIGAVIAILGAMVPYILETVVPVLTSSNGMWGPALAAGAAIGVNAIRKLIEVLQERQKDLDK